MRLWDGKIIVVTNQEFINLLTSGIIELGLVATEPKIKQLLEYYKLLLKWNRVYSLTAISDPIAFIKLHLLDGLSVVSHLKNCNSIVDVGSGMGVPAIVIAIWCPSIEVVAVDVSQKKAIFLRQVALELKLTNLGVINKKVEEYQPPKKFDVIISRAFANSNLFIKLTQHLLKDGGYWLAMKSYGVFAELEELQDYGTTLISVSIPDVLKYLVVKPQDVLQLANNQRYLLKITLI